MEKEKGERRDVRERERKAKARTDKEPDSRRLVHREGG